ncbi:MAG: hypothetical protein NC088_12955 [Bacteroides sp.]|nr:hypothetical protein [Bacteroides sp.]
MHFLNIFIPLDIFKGKLYLKGIESKLDAWLSFLACDDPAIIAKLIGEYPEFKKLYEDAYYICQNVERVMNMFSEELRLMDRNTVQLMIDEQQAEIDEKNATIDEQNITINEQNTTIGNLLADVDRQAELINTLIREFIKKCMECGDSQESIISQLCNTYDMTKEEATKHMEAMKQS